MKQGTGASRPGSQKMEPVSHKINPGAVSQIGNHVGTAKAVEPLVMGRGVQAPKPKETTHACGSQGKH